MVKSSYYTSTLPYQTKGKNTDLKVERVSGLSHILKCFNKAILFCKAYGSIFAYYGAGFGAFFSALYVAFFNEYEGGCKFPYLSEVARSGFGWLSFLVGTTIGCLPWILFSFDYYQAFRLLSMSINNSYKKSLFIWKQRLCLLLQIVSALGMNGTAYFDMGHYPLTHEICVILFAAPCNILFCISFYDMIKYGKEKEKRMILFKLALIICSFGGIILFTLLGRIDECKSVVISIEECLTHTTESQCFQYIDDYHDGTVLRHYPRCHVMHFWRGFAEFIAVFCSAEYICQLYYDRNKVQSLLFKEFGILPKNPYVLRELSETDENFCNALTPKDTQDFA